MSFFYLTVIVLSILHIAHSLYTTPAATLANSADSTASEIQTGWTEGNVSASLANLTTDLKGVADYPIDCFESGDHELQPAIPEDCQFVLDQYVLRLPDLFREQTWGFNHTADIDLSSEENRKWFYGQCLISVGSSDHTEQDTFRPVDVGVAAQRILQSCVIMSKFARGGTTRIGTSRKGFYVILGGLTPPPPRPTHSFLSLPSAVGAEIPNSTEQSTAKSLDKRASSALDLSGSSGAGGLNLRISCIKPGMPADGGRLNTDGCKATAKIMLTNPWILEQRFFTTEPTGGVHVPFVEEAQGCYFMVNTHSQYSSSASFSLLKVVYFASEIIQRCQLGGVAKLSSSSGFFVSVTSLDPQPLELGLSHLLNSTNSTAGLSIS